MDNKTRSVLRIVAVVLVLIAVMMHIGWIAIPTLSIYRFWFVVFGFVLVLVSSK